MPEYTTKIALVDNGSLKPGATLKLRQLATALGERCGHEVDAISLQHAHKIPEQELDQQCALILPEYLKHGLETGCREYIILPLFFGLSRAITSLIPEQKKQLEQQYGEFELTIADVLFPLPHGDEHLAQILFDNINKVSDPATPLKHVVLVDHGSPSPAVTEVREKVAGGLKALLGDQVELDQAVMERRKGRQYDFNGPLLEDYLHERYDTGQRQVVVSMMFLLPGRHAGEGGDIKTICGNFMQHHPPFDIKITPLVGDNPLLIELLASRLKSVMS